VKERPLERGPAGATVHESLSWREGRIVSTSRNLNRLSIEFASRYAGILLTGELFQVRNDFDAFIGLDKLEGHIALWNELLGTSQPFVERGRIPSDMSGFKRIRILEGRHGAGRAAKDTPQARPFLVLVERMAPGTTFFEKLLSAVAALGLPQTGQRHKREQDYPQGQAACHCEEHAIACMLLIWLF